MKKFLLLCFALILFLPELHAAQPNNGDLLLIFEELDLSGPGKKNVQALELYIRKNPEGESVDEALLRLARIYTEKKEPQKAAESYRMLVDNFPQSRFRPEALYELGFIMYRTGRLDDAKLVIEPLASDRAATIGLRARAARLLKEISAASYGLAPGNGAPAIGVLLPLKGSYAGFGEDALNGVLLAADVFGPKGANVEVIVKNAGADPASVERAFSELAGESRVLGLVGPLLSATVFDAAKYAQRYRIPVITLSQKEGITDTGDYVFRNSVTPADQARGLADYACVTLGKKRFGVLYPQNNYGVELARLFEKEVKARGCAVVRQAAYAQGTTDFSEEMKRVFGVQVKERAEGRRKIKEFTSTAKIDALFIPDSHEAAALITPYLNYYGIKGVQLLGANGWNNPKLVELGGRNVEGAVFVDGFFAGSGRSGTEEFTRKYKEAYGKDPGVLEAQAYDSATMLVSAIRDGNAGRDEVKDRLRTLKDFRGATGRISFDARREAVKKLFILTVENGRIAEVVE